MNYRDRIFIEPGKRGGKPCIRRMRITVYDVLDQTATAKLVAEWGIDYMHLAKFDGKWMIVNVLWQSPPKKIAP